MHSAAPGTWRLRRSTPGGLAAIAVGLLGGGLSCLLPPLMSAGLAAVLLLSALAVAQFSLALGAGLFLLPLLTKDLGPTLLGGALFVSGGRVVLLVLGLASIAGWLAGARPRLCPTRLVWVLLAGALLTVPSVVGSVNVQTSLLSFVSMNGEYYLVFLLAAGAATTLTGARRLSAVLVASGATLGVLGLLEATTHIRVLSLLPVEHTQLVPEQIRFGVLRVQATLPHPIFLGAVLALLLPIAVHFVFESKSLVTRSLAIGAAGAMLGALLLTVSRGAILAACIAVGVQLLIVSVRHKRYLWLPYAALVMLVVLVLTSPALLDGGARLWGALFERQSSEESMAVTYRLVLLRASIEAVLRRPWTGYGLNTFGELNLTGLGGVTGVVSVTSADNYYLMTLVEAGVPGLIGLLLVLGGVLILGWRQVHRAGDAGGGLALRAALFGALVGFVVLNATVGAYRVAQVSYVFWALAGLLLGAAHRPSEART